MAARRIGRPLPTRAACGGRTRGSPASQLISSTIVKLLSRLTASTASAAAAVLGATTAAAGLALCCAEVRALSTAGAAGGAAASVSTAPADAVLCSATSASEPNTPTQGALGRAAGCASAEGWRSSAARRAAYTHDSWSRQSTCGYSCRATPADRTHPACSPLAGPDNASALSRPLPPSPKPHHPPRAAAERTAPPLAAAA